MDELTHQETQLYFVAESAKELSLPPGMKGPAVVSARTGWRIEEVLQTFAPCENQCACADHHQGR